MLLFRCGFLASFLNLLVIFTLSLMSLLLPFLTMGKGQHSSKSIYIHSTNNLQNHQETTKENMKCNRVSLLNTSEINEITCELKKLNSNISYGKTPFLKQNVTKRKSSINVPLSSQELMRSMLFPMNLSS